MTRLLAIKNLTQFFEKQLVCVYIIYISFILLLAVTPSATSLEYQKYVFQRLMKNRSAAYLIERFNEKKISLRLLLMKT